MPHQVPAPDPSPDPVFPASRPRPDGAAAHDTEMMEHTDDFTITPTGNIVYRTQPFAGAFAHGTGSGLFAVGTSAWPPEAGKAAFFLRTMVRDALTRLAHALAENPDDDPAALQALVPPSPQAVRILDSFPAVPGSEYLTVAILQSWHRELAAHISSATGMRHSSLGDWLQGLGEPWNRIGKVFFHLAENRDDAEHPFAFMATFAHKASSGGAISHLPLASALTLYAEDHRAMLALLQPLRKAAETSPLIRQLLESREIYSPMAWTPARTYAFLQDTASMENAGIIVRIVNLWKKAPPRLQIAVTADTAGSEEESPVRTFSVHSLLRFSVAATLGGRAISKEELEELLAQGEGLVRFHGEWVAADPEKIRLLLDRWSQATRLMNNLGIPLIRGLRLLINGPNDTLPPLPPPDDDCALQPGHGLREALRALTSPVSGQNDDCDDIPGYLEAILRPYQREGVRFLRQTTSRGFGACLADDMGLGKTLQAIAWLLHIVHENTSGIPPLIIAPASLLGNWQDEISRFAPGIRATLLHSSSTSLPEQAPADPARFFSGTDLAITSYGMATRTGWLRDLDFPAIVLDEAQAIKNGDSQRTRAIRELHSPMRVALSGTPVENNLAELHSLMEFLNPGLLGGRKHFDTFTQRLNGDYTPLKKLVRPFILRRMKTDKNLVPDLPDKTELNAYCTLTPRQAALYHAEVQALHAVLEEPDPAQRLALILPFLSRFKQICNHPDQYLGTGTFSEEESGKFTRLRQLAEQIATRQEKLILFTQFRSMIDPLHDFLSGIFHRDGLLLHGGTPIPARQGIVRQFQQDAGPPFLVLSLKAAGTGLTLTQASHVIHFDRWWNPAVENQATDRAYRIGQHRNVLVHKLICRGTIEERIDDLLRAKQGMADSLFGEGLEKLLIHMNASEIEKLVTGH